MSSLRIARLARVALVVILLGWGVATRPAAAAPTIRLDTVLGDIVIEMLHEDAPNTVTNFLNYVVTGRYVETFFHRAPNPDFVVQGGGFEWVGGEDRVAPIDTFDEIDNEPGRLNTRGTLAMAKMGGNPDSATSQFFFNVVDNPDLDTQNGGFTVFAEVVEGMDVVDAIAALPIINAGGAFQELPVRNFNGESVQKHNVIRIRGVEYLLGQPGDYNANGIVDQGDLDLVLLNWGVPARPLPAGWFDHPPVGDIDQGELDQVLLNWGASEQPALGFLAGNAVPEPSSWLLFLICPLMAWLVRRR